MYAKGSLSPGFDAALKSSRAWSSMGAAASFKAIEDVASQVTLAGSMRPEVQRAFERGLPSATLAGGLDSATLAGGLSDEVYRLAAEAVPTGRFTSILDGVAYKRFREGVCAGLSTRVVDVAQELMSSATIASRLRNQVPKMAEGWLSGMRVKYLYSPAEAARLAARVGTFPIGSALLADKESFGGPMAQKALAEFAGRQAGIFPAFSHRQVQRMAEQHLRSMPKWSVAEIVRMNVGVNDLAGLGAPRAGLDPSATLHELAMRHGVGGIKPLNCNAGTLSSVMATDYPMPTLGTAAIAPASSRIRDIELPGPAVVRRRPQHQPRADHEVAPVAASLLVRRRRETVVAFFEAAELTPELEQLEAIEERLRTGSKPALVHAAVSARRMLQGVADRFYPARSGMYVCRFECPHKVGSEEVANRISAFVDERLRFELDTHTHKQFQGTLEWVYRWGGRGTHEECNASEALQGFLWLLEVMTMVARAYEAQHPARLSA